MERGVWKKPVVLEMYGRPGSVIIAGTVDAALMLIGAWPTKRTQAHIAAVMTCRDVLSGQSDIGLARANFIEAAFEAGYRIQPETFLNERWDLTPKQAEADEPPVGLADMIRLRAASSDDDGTSEAEGYRVPPPLSSRRGLSLGAEPSESLRELFGRLISLLGQIGRASGRSIGGLFGFGIARGTGRQAH
ncbi:Protein of unknown function [Rhizobium sp. NFR07]|uniref:DUF982 domain-containing protein n=1 Tax=Rhizobium sp. NFR07 TaxID=1566262 RepID=UPI0008E4547F|nr:DUF982 domain-containing protein [Rhizobium sp. NFR07]SFB61271.1 Protein of unknown function [Rhizobium sp. NFR07]